MKKGIVLIVIGVVGAIAAYSFRPPADIAQAFMMMGSGQQFYLKEPAYLGFMALSIALLLVGAFLMFKSSKASDEV